MSDSDERNKLVMVAVGEPSHPGDVPTVIFGLPAAAREFIANGKNTHTIDLRKVGIPCLVLMFGGETYEACAASLAEAAGEFIDNPCAPQTDLGIDPPTEH